MKRTKTQKKEIVKFIMDGGMTNTSQIQMRLATVYHIIITKRSIRLYKAELVEDALIQKVNSKEGMKGNAINPKSVQVLEPKEAIKKERKYDIVIDHFPFWIYCPGCYHGMRLENNPIQSCVCIQCGIAYSRREKCFKDMRDGSIIKKLSIYDPVIDKTESGN